jgi:hypothetical protein
MVLMLRHFRTRWEIYVGIGLSQKGSCDLSGRMFGKELFEVFGEDAIATTNLIGFKFAGVNQALDAPRR